MKGGTRLVSLGVFPVALILSSCGRAPDTVDDVIDRNTAAMGGRQAIEAMHSVAIDLHIVDPDFAVDGSYRATRPGKMRIDVNAEGKHVFTEAFRRPSRLAVENWRARRRSMSRRKRQRPCGTASNCRDI